MAKRWRALLALVYRLSDKCDHSVNARFRGLDPRPLLDLTIIERAILEPSLHLYIIFEHFGWRQENFVFYSLQMRLPDVGSSKKSTEGRLIICRATHRRRFCPPLSPGPTDPPTTVSARDTRPVWKEINRFSPYSKLFLVHSAKNTTF